MKLESPRRCRCVDALAKRNEPDAECLEVVEQRDEVSEVAPQAVEAPSYKDIELPTSSILQHRAVAAVPPRPLALPSSSALPAASHADIIHVPKTLLT
jgi:hypothetical protein